MKKSNIEEKVKIASDISKEVESDLRKLAFKEVLNFILWNDCIKKPPNEKIQPLSGSSGVNEYESLPELLSTIKPKSHIDRAIITGFFLFKFEEIDTFNANQVGDRLTNARVPKPSNMTDTLNGLIKRGFLREGTQVDAKKGFEITQKGIDYVENILSTK